MTAEIVKQLPPAIEIRRLTVSYSYEPVIWDVEAAFPKSAMSAIVGPNGAGKSTLLNACLGLVKPESGQVVIDGEAASAGLSKIAYVPQRESVDWDFPITVREVVEMGRYQSAGWFKRLKKHDHQIVNDALEQVGMAPFAKRQIGQLSGGQRQRVFIARALARQAEIMLLDEPFAGVDARTENDLFTLLEQLRMSGSTVVVVHHDITTVQERFDWALLLNKRAVACGPVSEVITSETLKRAYGVDSMLATDSGQLATDTEVLQTER